MGREGRWVSVLGAALLAAVPTAASGEPAAAQTDPAAIVDHFLRVFGTGHHDRLGPLLTDRVATGDGASLRRSQIVALHMGYTAMMFGPLRSFSCAAPAGNQVTCILHFQSRSLRQRYTVEARLISGIEALPFEDEPGPK